MPRVVLALALIGLIACRPRPTSSISFNGCSTGPLIGPAGHVELLLSNTRDSLLPGRQGRLVSIARWSSDSLARVSQPGPLEFRLTATRAQLNSAGFMTLVDTSALVPEDSEIVAFQVMAPEGTYELSVRVFGARGLDTIVPVRRGFTDTARLFVQAGGLTICS